MNAALTHVALHVHEFQACIDFYRDYCGMHVCHSRGDDHSNVVWLAEPGRENEFIIVVIDGGKAAAVQAEDDFGHLGFALESKARVDALAERAEREQRLVWPPRSEPYPVGYYCGIRDPGGNIVEFSYGQPLGPGARG
ncbi:MAG: VOC family protein [Myxococcota bacterium]|nr:VOC family protein [Myxococcota bacterium]